MSEENESREKEKIHKKCPLCGSNKISKEYELGIEVCKNCGNLLESEMIDTGPEWRSFSGEDESERSRTGSPLTSTIHDMGLSTEIDWRNKDSRGKSLSSKQRQRMFNLRKWQSRIRISDSKERNLAFALSELDKISSQLGLPGSARESAAKIYRKAANKGLIRGRLVEVVVAAAIYIACRENEIPRSLNDIVEASNVPKKRITKTAKLLARKLKVHIQPVDPVSYIAKIGSELDLSGETKAKASKVLEEAKKKGLTSGKEAKGLAAAAIYSACRTTGEKRSQREISKAAGVTEVTVRNRHKELKKKLSLDYGS